MTIARANGRLRGLHGRNQPKEYSLGGCSLLYVAELSGLLYAFRHQSRNVAKEFSAMCAACVMFELVFVRRERETRCDLLLDYVSNTIRL